MKLDLVHMVRALCASAAARCTDRTGHQPANFNNIMALLRHLCDFDEALMHWTLRWIAYPLRNPGAVMGTALIVNGDPGTGKRLFFERVVAALYGRAACIQSPFQPLSLFNDWGPDTRLVVSRGLFTKAKAQRLKRLAATGTTLTVHDGAVRPRQHRTNFIFLSASPEFLPVLDSDPRLIVIESPPPMQKLVYDAIVDEISHGGVDAFRHFLLYDLDMTGFDPRTRPPGNAVQRALLEVA